MKKIYTYGGHYARRNLTVADIVERKAKNVPMTQTTVTNAEEAAAAEAAGIDMFSMVSEDIHAVRAGAPETFAVSAVMMTSYVTNDEILREAVRACEAGSDAIYTCRGFDVVEMLSRQGIAVQGHLGLVPRKSTLVGGLRTVGKTAEEAMRLFEDFRRLEDAGAYAVEVECVATEALAEIKKHSRLVTHSIGSGPAGDVTFLFMEDLGGDVENPPRHAKAFGDMLSIRNQLRAERDTALRAFREAVQERQFPDAAHSVSMSALEQEKLKDALSRWRSVHC